MIIMIMILYRLPNPEVPTKASPPPLRPAAATMSSPVTAPGGWSVHNNHNNNNHNFVLSVITIIIIMIMIMIMITIYC